MTSLEKIAFIAIVAFGLTPIGAQCPGGSCTTRYFWNPWGGYSYSPCANGKCTVQTRKAEEPKDPEPKIIEVKPFCQQVAELVNAQRAALGLSALILDESLCQGCDSHSRYMRSNGFGHAYGIGGMECIAYGVSSPRAVVRLWLNSSGHRAILLGRGTKIGVGFSGTFWTLRIR